MNSILLHLAVSLVGGGGTVNIPTPLTPDQILQNGLNIAYFLAAIIAVIVIIIGGLTYSTSAGNASSVTKAKNMILYAVVGIVVIIIAYAITNFVIGRFK